MLLIFTIWYKIKIRKRGDIVLTIKVGKKKLKIFNLIILVLGLIIFLYFICNLVFMLPIFKTSYKYKTNTDNYETETFVTFKNKWFNCYVTESINVKSDYKLVYEYYVKDLLNDGYKNTKKDTYNRTIKVNGFCKQAKENYKNIHDSKYAEFMLNGNDNETIEYGNNYIDPYVIGKVNNKPVKEIDMFSNYNSNEVGSYVTSYSLSVNKYYTKRLYRTINVVDTIKPKINLSGDNTMTLNYDQKYNEPGFTAIDNYDGDITSLVKVSNKVNKNKPGTYKITYSVSDSSNNKTRITREVIVKEKDKVVNKVEPIIEKKDGITYVNGILVVNKNYSLPKDYNPKVNKEAYEALKKMQSDAKVLGLDLSLISGYRSYTKQEKLFNEYVKKDGVKKANTYSAKPGQSEHQTGLAFDIGSVDSSFENTSEAKWIQQNAHLYGFIVRYPKDKTDVTGYIYEPWHVRYLGVDIATKVKESGLALEEYLGIN